MNVNQALVVLRLRHVPDTQGELRKAYKEEAARWHPDRARVNGVSEQVASRRMSRVNQANALLMGVMRLRSESKLGRHYSDPFLGQHFVRDEYGYIVAHTPLQEMGLLLRGVLSVIEGDSQPQVDDHDQRRLASPTRDEQSTGVESRRNGLPAEGLSPSVRRI